MPRAFDNLTRRELVAGACGFAGLFALGGASAAIGSDEGLLRPPGGQDSARLLALCIRCDKCRRVCERHVIESAGIESGLAVMRTPVMTFDVKLARSYRRAEGMVQADVLANPYASILEAGGIGFCDFCMKCVEACPTGALAAFDPHEERLGIAEVDVTRCLAFENSGGCRKCADYCPFGAIELDDERRPTVDAAYCNGCGICENICPTSSYRSFSGVNRRAINVVAVSAASAPARGAEVVNPKALATGAGDEADDVADAAEVTEAAEVAGAAEVQAPAAPEAATEAEAQTEAQAQALDAEPVLLGSAGTGEGGQDR